MATGFFQLAFFILLIQSHYCSCSGFHDWATVWGWTNDFKSDNNSLVSLTTSNFTITRNLTFADASTVLSSAYNPANGRLFFVSRSTGACLFWQFDTLLLDFVNVLPMDVCIVEMHYDRFNGTIWGVTMTRPNLGHLNISTGVFTPIVALPSPGFPAKDSSAFDDVGRRYFITMMLSGQDLVLVYNVQTGTLLRQLANGSPTDFMQALQFDAVNDTLVGVTSGSWSLVAMNSRLGNRTVLRPLLPAPAAQYTSIYDPVGRMYHVLLGSSSKNAYNWASFNLTSGSLLLFDKSPHLYWHMHLERNATWSDEEYHGDVDLG